MLQMFLFNHYLLRIFDFFWDALPIRGEENNICYALCIEIKLIGQHYRKNKPKNV